MARLLNKTLLDKLLDAFVEWPADERRLLITQLEAADAVLVKVERSQARKAQAKPEPPPAVEQALLTEVESVEQKDGIRRD
jgi:hypothetical protein